jgi:glycogen(starch) synthase
MRILTVGNMYPPHHLGGYELLWQQANQRARERGHEIEVLTTDHREPQSSLRAQDEPGVHRTLRWYWLDHTFPRLKGRERRALVRHNHAEFARRADAFEPDVVAWWAMGGMTLSLLDEGARRGLASLFVVIDDWLIYGPQVDQQRKGWRSGPLRFDGPVIFCSQHTRDKAAQHGVRPDESSVVVPGIDERFLRRAPSREWSWQLAYIGRIDERKGIATAVSALEFLPPEATLTIVGGGDETYSASLRARATEIGVADRVRFSGPASIDELPEAYADADAVVFPVAWDEPWGLVPLEAMGIGRPVIATGRGGSGEYLRDEVNSLRFEAGDARALAAAVRRLADDAGLRSRLVDAGERTASEHRAAAWADQIVDAYEAARPRQAAA